MDVQFEACASNHSWPIKTTSASCSQELSLCKNGSYYYCPSYNEEACVFMESQNTWMLPAMASMLLVLMLALGATIEVSMVKKVIKTPKPLLIGVLCQFVIMPLVGLFLCSIFSFHKDSGRNEVMALSLIMIASSPGGSTSNLVSSISMSLDNFAFNFLL